MPAGDVDYEARGPGYAAHRRPDPRIAAMIRRALGGARTVLNVGAGAGSYEPDDRVVLAVEPSAVMRAQRPRDAAPCIRGVAEALPLDDGAMDAAMAVLTCHQWPNLAKGLRELRRVARGPVVVVSGDAAAMGDFWLNDYAPELIAAEQRRFPPLEAIAAAIGARSEILTIPVPADCTDGFIEAFHGRPERLLDPAVRQAQSSWSFMPEGYEARFAEKLGADLGSGDWDARYGAWRGRSEYPGALRMVVGQAV